MNRNVIWASMIEACLNSSKYLSGEPVFDPNYIYPIGGISLSIADAASRYAQIIERNVESETMCISIENLLVSGLSDEVVPVSGEKREYSDSEIKRFVDSLRLQSQEQKPAVRPCIVTYGYSAFPWITQRKDALSGMWRVDLFEAMIIIIIFEWRKRKFSLRRICRLLNEAGISSPTGACWKLSHLKGDAGHNSGILNNELVAGVFVFNRYSGKSLNPLSEWQIEPLAYLRIVNRDLWISAQQVIDAEVVPDKIGAYAADMITGDGGFQANPEADLDREPALEAAKQISKNRQAPFDRNSALDRVSSTSRARIARSKRSRGRGRPKEPIGPVHLDNGQAQILSSSLKLRIVELETIVSYLLEENLSRGDESNFSGVIGRFRDTSNKRRQSRKLKFERR